MAILIPFCLVNVSEAPGRSTEELMEMGTASRAVRCGCGSVSPCRCWCRTLLSAIRIACGIGWKIALVSELVGAPAAWGI